MKVVYITKNLSYQIEHLSLNEIYEAEWSAPLRYSTGEQIGYSTGEQIRYLIVNCPDGINRYFPTDNFITLDEFRLRQLDKLDI
jgi:hypothetical protein